MDSTIRILKTIKFLIWFRPFSLNQFKYFCIAIDGMSQKDWKEQEEFILNNITLRNFFKIK